MRKPMLFFVFCFVLSGCAEELSHRHCTVTAQCLDGRASVTYSVCGEQEEQDWLATCTLHREELACWYEGLCHCVNAPDPCDEPGVVEIDRVDRCNSHELELCNGKCVWRGECS